MISQTFLTGGVAIAFAILALDTAANDLYFPDESWETVSPAAVGWDSEKLEDAIDFAMKRRSSSVVILHGGKILAERHEPVKNAALRYRAMTIGRSDLGHSIEDVASAQKSIVSLLVGIAIDQGLLSLEDPVLKHLGPGWSKASTQQEQKITVRHLLTMTSGLDTKLAFSRPAGTKWSYNTNAYAKSLACVEAASKLSANALTTQWLLQPVGMKDSRWKQRPWSKSADANTVGFTTTARDLARFGLLIQANATWDGKDVLVGKNHLRDSLSPSQKLKPSYGYLWWLNDQAVVERTGKRAARPMVPAAPPDLVAAKGALGRRCFVVPSMNLVVTRLGDDPNGAGGKNFDNEFWRRLMLAVDND